MESGRASDFFHCSSLGSANGLRELHSLFYRRLGEKSAFLHFFENPGAFVFLFKPPNRTIDRFVFSDYYADQTITSISQVFIEL